MGILNNPAILRIRVPCQDFQPMEILNLELLVAAINDIEIDPFGVSNTVRNSL